MNRASQHHVDDSEKNLTGIVDSGGTGAANFRPEMFPPHERLSNG
jgi:hypothetical protein